MSAPETVAETVLEAYGLGREVTRGWLFRDLDLRLSAGQCLALAGPSGAGKSLLLRLLAGLDPLQAGAVYLQGKAQADWEMPAYRARVMYLPQSPAFADTMVEASLAYSFGFRQHRKREWSRETAAAMALALGRDDGFLKLATASLSGGEAQLVGLMRALLLEPQVLLLDEATANMDPATTRRAESLIGNWLQARPGRTCLWASHDASQRERVASGEIRLQDQAA